MPIMPRANKKAEKIAFDILGKPCNMRDSKPKKIKSKSEKYNVKDRYDNVFIPPRG